jgi:hypothetical protein
MKILCTHPGRYGDCLWALPTVRALSQSAHVPVDLLLSPTYASNGFQELLRQQDYIGTVTVAGDWEILETAPITPREPPSLPSGYDAVVHLAYEGWPSLSLPWEICGIAEKQIPLLRPIDLDTPWITAELPPQRMRVNLPIVGFTDEHFELKVGLVTLLRRARLAFDNISSGPRWQQEAHVRPTPWPRAAAVLAHASLFAGCCSALHVLACAVGTPVVVAEPAPARHHDVFYPYGKISDDRVRLLLGNDGHPTIDSRHLLDAIEARQAVRT